MFNPLKSSQEVLKRYANDATLHGISRIYGAERKWSRLIWACILATFLGYLTYQVSALVGKLFDNEYLTIVSMTTQTTGMTFPAITVCHPNLYPKRRIEDFLERQKLNANAKWNNAEWNINQLADVAYQFDELFVPGSCFFNGKKCSNFKMVTTKTNGNCFVFNVDKKEVQPRPALKYGMSFILNLMINTHLEHIVIEELKPVGGLISINSPEKITNLRNDAIIVAPNQLTRIAMKRKEILRLKHPYPDNCTESSELIGNAFNYTPDLCLDICFINEMYSTCKIVGFSEFMMAKWLLGKTLPLDEGEKEDTCLVKFNSEYPYQKNHCYCSPLCDEVNYATTISTGVWPAPSQLRNLMHSLKDDLNLNLTGEEIQANFAAVQIYFQDFTTDQTLQMPAYTLTMFFSDLGGQVGLWIGASVFSVIEIVSLLCQLIYLYFPLKKRNPESLETKEKHVNTVTQIKVQQVPP